MQRLTYLTGEVYLPCLQDILGKSNRALSITLVISVPLPILFAICIPRPRDRNGLLRHRTKTEYMPQSSCPLVVGIISDTRILSLSLPIGIVNSQMYLRIKLLLSNITMVLGAQRTRAWKSCPSII